MASYMYCPKHPLASPNGFVTKEEYYNYIYATTEDKGMTKGNQRVSLNFISDTMDATRHMCLPPDAPLIESKAKFRQITKDHGCIEIGNETKHLKKPRKRINPDKRERREDIKRAMYNLRNGQS